MIFENLQNHDLKDIVPIFIKAFNREPWNDSWTDETVTKRLGDMINTPGYYGLKLYEDERIIGAVLGSSEQYYDGMYYYIKEFFIDNDYQGKGLGTVILQELIGRLKNMGIKRVILLTANAPSTIGFYKKNSFKIDEDIVSMSMNLNKRV